MMDDSNSDLSVLAQELHNDDDYIQKIQKLKSKDNSENKNESDSVTLSSFFE